MILTDHPRVLSACAVHAPKAPAPTIVAFNGSDAVDATEPLIASASDRCDLGQNPADGAGGPAKACELCHGTGIFGVVVEGTLAGPADPFPLGQPTQVRRLRHSRVESLRNRHPEALTHMSMLT